MQTRFNCRTLLYTFGPGLDFIHFETGFGFYPCSPGLDFTNDESGSELGLYNTESWSEFYQASPGLDFIHFEPRSEFYQACPDFTSVRLLLDKIKLYTIQNYKRLALLYGPGHVKTCLMSYTNNKGADQPAHTHSLISTFVVRCLDSMICILAALLYPKFQDSS